MLAAIIKQFYCLDQLAVEFENGARFSDAGRIMHFDEVHGAAYRATPITG